MTETKPKVDSERLLVDERFAKLLAEELGCNWITAFECLGGEKKTLANEWMRWIEEDEAEYRRRYGVRATFREFNAVKKIRNRARREKRGAWRDDAKD